MATTVEFDRQPNAISKDRREPYERAIADTIKATRPDGEKWEVQHLVAQDTDVVQYTFRANGRELKWNREGLADTPEEIRKDLPGFLAANWP